MSVIEFSSQLSEVDRSVVSDFTIELLKQCAEATENPEVIITSTLRPPERQAKAMFDNLSLGIRIRYAEPGHIVTALFDDCRAKNMNRNDTLQAMTEKIAELAEQGKLVSRHCVPLEEYNKRNIVDVSRYMPNVINFIKALAKRGNVAKIITPVNSHFDSPKVSYDRSEPALHIEINQQPTQL